MFQSGTRTAVFCYIIGFMVFLVLSKSFKIMIPSAIVGGIMLALLIFTDIGNGNQQIRRMRSAFDRNDASANVRTINQQAIKKYIKDAPWGIGIGSNFENVPANNKYRKLSTIPPDSEYVFIWVHTGPIGLTVFLVTTAIMFLGACSVVFRLKSRSLLGVGAGLCGAFASMQLGGYGNQVLMQFPNCLMFYGGLAIVYVLPYIEPEWVALEEKRLAKQAERIRLRQEKKLAQKT
jgi:O-antigen ligase